MLCVFSRQMIALVAKLPKAFGGKVRCGIRWGSFVIGSGPPFFGGRIRGREVKYPIDSVLKYENQNIITFTGETLK